MEHPYYKIDEVSEILQISNSDIIRCAASGRLNIYILTAKFKVFFDLHEIKHNLCPKLFSDSEDFQNYCDYVREEIVKYEKSMPSDDAVEDKSEYIQLSKKCLLSYEAGDLDAKVSIDYAVANDDYLVHYYVLSFKNENWEIPALQDCELIILSHDLKIFQDLVYSKNNVKGEDFNALEDDMDITTNLNGDRAIIETRKKLIPLQRVTNEGLMLIHNMCSYYNVKYLDELQGLTAWGKILRNEYQDELIVSVDKNHIHLKTMRMDRSDFLEKYRKRFS